MIDFLLFLLLSSLVRFSVSFDCMHDRLREIDGPLRTDVRDAQNYGESAHLLHRRAVEQLGVRDRIRIYFDVQYITKHENSCDQVGKTISLIGESDFQCTADDILTPEKLNFLQTDLLVYAELALESTLKVRCVYQKKQFNNNNYLH